MTTAVMSTEKDVESSMPLTTSSSTAPPTKRQSSHISNSSSSIVYALVFFSCMIIMELTLEGTQKAFSDLQALPFAVTLFQFASCFLLPVCVSRGATLRDLPKTKIEIAPYLLLSLCVFGSSGLATMSIRYVSYPTKVVLKSTKLIPVMIVSTLLHNNARNYSTLEYLAACLLCAGAAGYGFGEASGSKKSNNNNNSYLGIILLSMSVVSDAFTPNIQQRLMAPPAKTITPHNATTTPPRRSMTQLCHKAHRMVLPPGGGLGVSASTLMTNANLVGGIGIFCYMAVTGDLVDALGVAFVEPRLFLFLTMIGTSLAVAVFCYTRLIQESGSVVAAGVATLRKVVTVVLSYAVYPKPFTVTHAVSSVLVLGGVLLSSYAKQQGVNSKK